MLTFRVTKLYEGFVSQMTELESEFEKHKNGPKAVPEKLVRSEQAKAKVIAETPAAVEEDAAADGKKYPSR